MLLYILFWMFNGLIIHFYIIFGTNLLTGGPAQIAVFAYFRVSQKKNIKQNETFGNVIFGTNVIQRTWTLCQESNQESTRQGARLPPWARPPPSWGPRCSTDVLLPPIYTYVPPNYQIRSQNPNSTVVTFCIREIHLWAFSGAPPEGASITEDFYINTIASPMKCE